MNLDIKILHVEIPRSVGLFSWFFRIYDAGPVITVGTTALHGTLTVLGRP